jgi:N-acetylglucosamine kinase-like BadF-type ATPase
MAVIVAGVDGGGTRTRVSLAEVDGTFLGYGDAGSGNYHDIGERAFAENLNAAMANAWRQAGLDKLEPAIRRIDAIFLGLGSIVTAADRAEIRSIVARAPWAPTGAKSIDVDHDLRIAHAGCLAGEPGIVLIVGTGSSCFGRDESGRTWKTGGWGPLLDDLGSGHWLGRQAMIAAIRQSDGRGKATSLTPAVLAALELEDANDILRRVEMQGMTRSEIARLARLVLASSSEGDEVACEIVQQGVNELALLVSTTARCLGLGNGEQPVLVAATGGLIDSGETYIGPLKRAINDQVPHARFVENQATPVEGALLLAIHGQTGGQPSPHVLRRLRDTTTRA